MPYSPSNTENKLVQVFVSHFNKEPCEERNSNTYTNPSVIPVPGNKLNKSSGKYTFERDWVYFTVLSTNSDVRIRVVARFK